MKSRYMIALLALGALSVAGCIEGPQGPIGADGADGVDGADGSDGSDGEDGADGSAGSDGSDGSDGEDGVDGSDGLTGPTGADGGDGLDARGYAVADLHGQDYLMSTGEFEEADKEFVTAEITAASADEDGTVTVEFSVVDEEGGAVIGVTGVDFDIVKLVAADSSMNSNHWVSYIYDYEEVEDTGAWEAAVGTMVDQAYRESDGEFTDNGDGTYGYVFSTDISAVVTPVEGTAIDYDRSLTHRVSLMIGGHSGPTGDAYYDFVPDGSAISLTRDIVQTEVCQECHGWDFHGHGGDRLQVGVCVTCHLPGSSDAHSGNSLSMPIMIHRIHAGAELPTVPGDDGEVWDDPGTDDDETADNNPYVIYGHGNAANDYSEVEFPALVENCTKCHTGDGADVDNWKDYISRDACGSCHDDIDWATGTNHGGGAATSDRSCSACHNDGFAASPETAHDIEANEPDMDVMEFDVDITFSPPLNGLYYEAGERPVVSIVLNEDGSPIDHTTIYDDEGDNEGCTIDDDPCPARDGYFDHLYVFVHGPRAQNAPVLTMAARAEVASDGSSTWDLSSAGSLDLVVDNGYDVRTAHETLAAAISVDVDTDYFADPSAATADEIVDWLNDDADFAARAIAEVDADGDVTLRSRNLGKLFAIQLEDSDVTDVVFDSNTDVNVIGGSYASNNLVQFSDAADNDPMTEWTEDEILYTLDDVADLAPGTYVVSVEIADAGRVSTSDYRTPSVAWASFQVGQEDEEPMVASGCASCHASEDWTMVFDYYRHHKIFNDEATDQCGGCHDYQNRYATGDWSGALPISRRVHAVHNGADLNYPVDTVGHDDDPEGRYWDITFPQDVRNCEVCHTDETSGTWATNANRLACGGCHDADAATAHMNIMTWDPTPTDPWSGDEEESCVTCH